MVNNHKRLERWVRQKLLMSNIAWSRLVLKHVTGNGKSRGSEIGTFDPPVSLADDAISSFVHDVMSSAEIDSEGLPGVQAYVLMAYDDTGSLKSRFTMRLESESIDDDSDLSEPATKQGSLQQQMRHNEALMKGLISSQTQSTYALTKIVQYLGDQNETLMKSHVEQVMAVEELLNQKHERDEMSRLNDAKIEGIRSGIDTVKQLAPVVARRMAKRRDRRVLPAPSDPVLGIIRGLASSLSQEQIQGIASNLTDAQRMSFMELMTAAQEAESAN